MAFSGYAVANCEALDLTGEKIAAGPGYQVPFAEQIRGLFQLSCKKNGLGRHWPKLSAAATTRDAYEPPPPKYMTTPSPALSLGWESG